MHLQRQSNLTRTTTAQVIFSVSGPVGQRTKMITLQEAKHLVHLAFGIFSAFPTDAALQLGASSNFLLETLTTAQAFENVNIYVLLLKTRHLKRVAIRHQQRPVF